MAPLIPMTAHDRQLAVLQQTYPAWHIKHRGGMWSAARASAPTEDQAAAGVHRYIVQPSPEALAAVLAYQVGISHGARIAGEP